MRILLDENVPIQAKPILERVLIGHVVEHVDTYAHRGTPWKSKKDRHLIKDAAARGFAVFVTKDSNQLSDPAELQIIKRAGIHHVRFAQATGVAGLGRAVGALVAAMPDVIAELVAADGQRLVHIRALDPKSRRHDTIHPRVNPPAYWRGRGSGHSRSSRRPSGSSPPP